MTKFNHLLEHVDEVICKHIRVTIQAVIDRLQGEINRFTRMNFRGYYIEYISHIYSGSKNNSEDFFPENKGVKVKMINTFTCFNLCVR